MAGVVPQVGSEPSFQPLFARRRERIVQPPGARHYGLLGQMPIALHNTRNVDPDLGMHDPHLDATERITEPKTVPDIEFGTGLLFGEDLHFRFHLDSTCIQKSQECC